MSVTKQFARYVTQNIFGMLGISCYIIADTFFIAKAAGTDGITVLNHTAGDRGAAGVPHPL